MLVLSEPVNQDRLNACVYELLRLNVCGTLCVPGRWDCSSTLDYLERRLKQTLIATLREDGSVFVVRGRMVCFTEDEVFVEQT